METLNSSCKVFQTDSEIVKQFYREQNNYLIEFNKKAEKEWCAIYFCSNDIYYPNTEEIFRKRIIEKNFFEWYHTRIDRAYKHIFIRDIFKQWYLSGINENISSPEKLIEFLRKETAGYKVITVGSSAGGYAAILYGYFINTQYTLSFNPQFELKSLLQKSTEEKNPLIFRICDKRKEYFDITQYINKERKIFYFYSNKSLWDMEQYNHIEKKITDLYIITFRTKHHGIPFLKVALPKILNLSIEEFQELSKTPHSPICFTIKIVGVLKTISGLYKQVKQAYLKRRVAKNYYSIILHRIKTIF